MDLVLVRVLFVLIVAIACYFIQPFGRSATFDAGLGAVIGLAVIVFEWRLRLVSLKRLIGAAIGSILGIIGPTCLRWSSAPASRRDTPKVSCRSWSCS